MIHVRQRYLALLAIAGGSLLIWALLSMMLAHVAHADPVLATQDALTADWDAISRLGLIPGLAMVLFAGTAWALKRNESEHWIAQGRTLALVTAGVSVLGAVLAWKYMGAQPGTIMAALMAGIALVLHPETKASTPVLAGATATDKPAETVTKVFPPAGMLAVLLVGAALAGLTGSGCGASQRESAIRAAVVTIDAAREAFVIYDRHKQQEIVDKATSLDDGKAKLAAYRASRDKVEAAFTTAYRAAIVAHDLNDDPSLAALARAVVDAEAVIKAVTGGSK